MTVLPGILMGIRTNPLIRSAFGAGGRYELPGISGKPLAASLAQAARTKETKA